MALPPKIQAGLDRIREDELRGAAELTDRAVFLFSELMRPLANKLGSSRTGPYPNIGSIVDQLEYLVLQIASVKPTMAPLINLANGIGVVYESGLRKKGKAHGLEMIIDYLEYLQINQPIQMRQLLDSYFNTISERYTHVFTISHSSTLVQLMYAAQERERIWEVLISEARPGHEGLTMALVAKKAGHRVTVSTDAELPGLLNEYSPREALVIVGADTVSKNSFTNKSGTWPLILSAHQLQVPIFVLALSNKFLPKGLHHIHNYKGTPGTIPVEWEDLADEVFLHNYLFERIPMHLVDGLICEDGLLKPNEVNGLISDLPVCQWLRP